MSTNETQNIFIDFLAVWCQRDYIWKIMYKINVLCLYYGERNQNERTLFFAFDSVIRFIMLCLQLTKNKPNKSTVCVTLIT